MKSPFKFLDAYSKEDKDLFFGRDKEVEEIYEKLFKGNLLLLYGASGAGKTSILNCGIANKFDVMDWFPILVRRRSDINESTRQELMKLAETPIPESKNLSEAVHSIYLDYFKPVYIIFDQFEELFISGTAEEVSRFLDFLTDLLNRPEHAKVIITIREEFLAHFNSFEERIPAFFDNRYRVEHATAAKAEEIIQKTCSKVNIVLEHPALVAREIIKNITSESSTYVELTYLQVYLDRLFRHYARSHPEPVVFSFSLVEEVGDIQDVLALFLEEQISRLEDPALAWSILKTFVTAGGTKRTTTLQMVKEDLKSRGYRIMDGQVEEYLQKFLNLKILRYLDESK